MPRIPLIAILGLITALYAAPDDDPGSPAGTSGQGRQRKARSLIEAGASFAIGSDIGTLPQIGYFRDLPSAWQVGVQARTLLRGVESGYDRRPQAFLSIRKLWEEDSSSLRNSEYFSASLGVYYGYDFRGEKDGLRPMGALSLGKFWMPFASRPWGLDLSLDLITLNLPFIDSGHFPGHSEQTIVTFGFEVFYVLP